MVLQHLYGDGEAIYKWKFASCGTVKQLAAFAALLEAARICSDEPAIIEDERVSTVERQLRSLLEFHDAPRADHTPSLPSARVREVSQLAVGHGFLSARDLLFAFREGAGHPNMAGVCTGADVLFLRHLSREQDLRFRAAADLVALAQPVLRGLCLELPRERGRGDRRRSGGQTPGWR